MRAERTKFGFRFIASIESNILFISNDCKWRHKFKTAHFQIYREVSSWFQDGNLILMPYRHEMNENFIMHNLAHFLNQPQCTWLISIDTISCLLCPDLATHVRTSDLTKSFCSQSNMSKFKIPSRIFWV